MTAIFLAGAEVETLTRALLDNGVKNILYSFFYIREMRREGALIKHIEANPDKNWFLDSGAFTYYMKAQSPDAHKLPAYREYKRQYFQFIEQYGHLFCRIAELDLDNTLPEISHEEVYEWLEEMLDTWPHLPITPVWHYWRMFDKWRHYLVDKRVKTLAIGRSPGSWGDVRRLVMLAKAARKPVHGLAITRAPILKWIPFDTVDSSVTGDTLVWVRSKNRKKVLVLPIEDLFRGWQKGLYRGWETPTAAKGPMWWESTWAPLGDVLEHKVRKPIHTITLESGARLKTTPDHSLFRMTPQGELVEVEAADISVGDFIATVRAVPWGGSGLRTKKVNIQRTKCKSGNFVTEHVSLDEDFLLFCGLWVADGHFTEYGVGISAMNDKECADVVNRIAGRYACKVTMRPDGVTGIVNSARLLRHMQELGFGGYSTTKSLPQWFWALSREQACTLLRGYFSGDGCASGSISAQTSSHELWRQLCLAIPSLLNTLVLREWNAEPPDGVYGPVAPYGKVILRGTESKTLFQTHIGFLQPYKNNSAQESTGTPRGEYFNRVPTALASRPPRRAYCPKKQCSPLVENESTIERGTDPAAFTSHTLSPDIVYLRVTHVDVEEASSRAVYDLEVPGTEKFVADGVLIHNSTWVGGQRYGTLYVFKDNKFQTIANTQGDVRRRLRMYFKRLGCDPNKIINTYRMKLDVAEEDLSSSGKESVAELRKANVIAWKRFSDRLEYMRVVQKMVVNPFPVGYVKRYGNQDFEAEEAFNSRIFGERALREEGLEDGREREPVNVFPGAAEREGGGVFAPLAKERLVGG